MRYFLSVVCFLIIHLAQAQQGPFDFDQAWEEVYKAELQFLPKTASTRVDSIYQVAARINEPRQLTKALIYQAKYSLLLEEESHKKLVERFQSGIDAMQAPYRQILQNQLAALIFDIYQVKRWQIRQRSKLAEAQGDIDTWDKSRFFNEIKDLYLASLELPAEFRAAPLKDYEEIVKSVDESRKYRPLLIDLLSHNALSFFKENEDNRIRPAEPFVMNDRNLYTVGDKFSGQILTHTDSGSYHLYALKIYQDLIRIHREDSTQWARTDLDLDRFDFVKEQGAVALAIDRYRRVLVHLLQGLKGDSAAVMPYLHLARLEFKLGDEYVPGSQPKYQFKKVEALAHCDSILQGFSESHFTNEARLLKQAIIQPRLELSTEAYVLPNEPTKMLATYRNYDEIYFRTYRISHDDYQQFRKLQSDSARQSKLDSYTTALSWNAPLKNVDDHQQHRQEVLFHAHDRGTYLVVAFADEERTRPLEFEKVQVTRLAVVKTPDRFRHYYQVFDRKNGRPVEGVDVHFYAEASRNRVGMDKHYKTGKNGLIDFNNKAWRNGVSIRLAKGADSMRVDGRYLREDASKEKDDGKYEAEFNLFYDRGIYRPGQELYFKGILYKKHRSGSEVAANEILVVNLFDPNNEKLWSEEFTTNEFGSIAGKVALPKSGITGSYNLIVAPRHTSSQFIRKSDARGFSVSKPFRVEEYKRPKFEITFDRINEAYHFNDSIFVKGQATALAGSQLSNAKVAYEVSRYVEVSAYHFYSDYRGGFESTTIAHGELTTDELGSFVIPFKALVEPSATDNENIKIHYAVSVTVTDINGESREASTGVAVAKNPYSVEIGAKALYEKGPDSLSIPVFINSLNGTRQALGGTLTIERLSAPSAVKRSVPWEQPDFQGFTRTEHDILFPNWPNENEDELENWPVSRQVLQMSVTPGRENSLKIGGHGDWSSGYYKATFITKPERSDSITAEKVFLLRAANPRRLPDKARFEASLDKNQYEIGETAIVSFGTAAKEMGVYLSIVRDDQVEHKRLRLRNEVSQVRIPIQEGDESGISLYYFYAAHNDFQSGQLEINVIKKWPKLMLETGTFRNKLQPGSPEQWSFKVKGEEGEAASAELLASMYDASLDQFTPNNWRFSPYYQFRNNRYIRVDDLGNFGTTNFRKLIYTFGYIPQSRNFEDWNWFGLSIRNPKFHQSNYVNKLRYRRNARPVLKSEKRDYPKGIIRGKVTDEFGKPFQFVNVVVAGTVKGSATDEKGDFRLEAKPGEDLYISFLGYKTFRFTLKEDNYYEIQLQPDMSEAGEVVVVGYGTQEKRSVMVFDEVAEEELADEVFLIAEASSAADALGINRSGVSLGYAKAGDLSSPGAASAIRLRGTNSITGENAPLYVIDGVTVTQLDMDPEQFAAVRVLQPNEAMTLFGAKGANGVVIITTKKEEARQNALLAQVKARTDLRETAFFLPQLRTNEAGEVSFNFTSPESLTRWKLQLLAHNKTMASALMRQSVVTQKELMLLPNAPRFLREGDELVFSAKIASLSADTLNGFARLELFDAATEKPIQEVIAGSEGNPVFRLAPKGNAEVSWILNIPDGLQAVRYRIVAVADDFSDGEENILPVLSKRMMVQESQPLWVNAHTSKTFTLDKLAKNESATLKNHRLTMNVTTNPVWEAIRSLPYLVEYPYECAEQTFARLYANSLGQHIIEQQPAIRAVFEKWRAAGQLKSKLDQNQELKAMLIEETPWLRAAKSESEQQKRLAKLFEADALAQNLEASLKKLKDMQMSSGGFPWFSGSDRPSLYITQHIVIGLAHLAQLTGADHYSEIVNPGLAFMKREFNTRYHKLVAGSNFDPDEKHIGYYQAQYLYALSLTEQANEGNGPALNFYKKQAFQYWPEMSLQSRAMIALFAHSQGDKRQVKRIMRSLKQYALESEELGNYWKNNVSGWYNWQAPIETQALMIEAFSKLTKDEAFVNGLRQWLLNHKRVNSWSTTKATTEAIYALLFTGDDWAEPNNSVKVTAGNETVLSPELSKSRAEAGTGQIQKIWAAEKVNPDLAKVVIENQGKVQVWGGLYWQYFEDLDRITPAMGPLNLEKQLFRVNQTATGEELEIISENSQLQVGDLVRVRIVLKTDRAMEFIHLKDMRASGFEPVNVLSGYRWQDRLGYYESTRDAATNFFIEYLPKGTFVFEYDLRANNQGDFSNGITSIQNMYAPEFSSHSEGIRVKIENEE